jgi:multiple sugar transport system ATP-binding protein
MRAEILKVHRAVSATAVYVTHDQVEALTMGDRIAVMTEGRIHQVGTPDELYDAPVDRFVASFIGTPAMGFVVCRVNHAGDRAELVAECARVRFPPALSQAMQKKAHDDRVIVGIRPERVILMSEADAQRGDVMLHGAVEAVEMLGAEQLVHVATSSGSFSARVARDRLVKVDEHVWFGAPARDVYLFDGDTGLALGA